MEKNLQDLLQVLIVLLHKNLWGSEQVYTEGCFSCEDNLRLFQQIIWDFWILTYGNFEIF